MTESVADPLTVRPMDAPDADRWDRFVEEHPKATFFHLSAWKTVIERSFGHETRYLLAEDGTSLRGVLPLARIRSRLFGDALISTPFCVYGGALAADDAARRALEAEACRIADRLGVDHLELRNLEPRNPDWPAKPLYVTFRREIDPDPDVNLKAIPRKQRAVVRKAIESDLASEIDDDVDRLWRIYSESVRNLGTPVFPRRYFRALREAFGDRCEVLTVTDRGQGVASVLSFYFRDEVLPYYGGGVEAARALRANDFLYWELMRRASERGVRVFDFGRSKRDVGSFRFKKHWGFEPQPLHYEYHLVRAAEVPDVNPLNPKYRLFVEGWKRMPLPLSRWLGPWLARSLG